MISTKIRTAAFATVFALGAFAAHAENPMVGGAPMYAEKNIVENAVNSKDHTTLVAAVKAAGYSEAQVIEIVQHVALNTWTNYINEVAGTEIDFPVVQARLAA